MGDGLGSARNYLLSNPGTINIINEQTQLRGITGCIRRLQIFYDFSHLHCTFVGNRGKFQEMAWQKVWPGWEYVRLLQVCALGLNAEFDFYVSYPTWACLIVQASDRCLNLSVFLMCIICPFSLLFNWKLPNFQTEDFLRKGLMGVLCFSLSHQATYNLGMTKWISSIGQKRFLSSTGGAHSQATPAIVACYRDHLRDFGIAGDFSNLFSPSSYKLWQQTLFHAEDYGTLQ